MSPRSFTNPHFDKNFEQCKLGNIEVCAELTEDHYFKNLINSDDTKFKWVILDGEAEKEAYKKEVCPIALDVADDKFKEYFEDTFDNLDFETNRDLVTLELETQWKDMELKNYLRYTKHLDAIEENCLEFPLIDCVPSEEVDQYRNRLRKRQIERLDHEDTRACAIVAPAQDSQIAMFGRSLLSDSLYKDKMEALLKAEIGERDRSIYSLDRNEKWKKFFEETPSMRDEGHDVSWHPRISQQKHEEIVRKLGNTYNTHPRNMITTDCIHPVYNYGEMPIYTRNMPPDQDPSDVLSIGGLRGAGLKMPARMRLESLRTQLKIWWGINFSRLQMKKWDYPDIENLFRVVRKINQKFPSEATAYESFILEVQEANIMDNWNEISGIQIYFDSKNMVFHYIYKRQIQNLDIVIVGTFDPTSLYDDIVKRNLEKREMWNKNEISEIILAKYLDIIETRITSQIKKGKEEKIYYLKSSSIDYIWILNQVIEPFIYMKQVELTGKGAEELRKKLDPNTEITEVSMDDILKISELEVKSLKLSTITPQLIHEAFSGFDVSEIASEVIYEDLIKYQDKIVREGNYGQGVSDDIYFELNRIIQHNLGVGDTALISVEGYQTNQFYYETVAIYIFIPELGNVYPTIIYDTEFNEFYIAPADEFTRFWILEHPDYRDAGITTRQY